MHMNAFRYLALCVAFLCALKVTSSSPLNRRRRSTKDLPWATPCAPSNTAVNVPTIPMIDFTPPLSDLVDELHIRSLEGHSLAGTLKTLFFDHRIESSLATAEYLDTIHFTGYPLPADVEEWTSSNDTGTVIQSDYINLSRVLVFLEAIRLDAIEHENSSQASDIKNLENKLYSTLCHMQSILDVLELTIASHVSRDVMSDALREISVVSERRQRDYVVAKDAVHLLTAKKENYLKMKLGLSE